MCWYDANSCAVYCATPTHALFIVLGFLSFFAHKPRQIACVGFVLFFRVRVLFFFSRDTGRIWARQVLPLMASVSNFTANEKPRQNASRSPRQRSSVWLSLIF